MAPPVWTPQAAVSIRAPRRSTVVCRWRRQKTIRTESDDSTGGVCVELLGWFDGRQGVRERAAVDAPAPPHRREAQRSLAALRLRPSRRDLTRSVRRPSRPAQQRSATAAEERDLEARAVDLGSTPNRRSRSREAPRPDGLVGGGSSRSASECSIALGWLSVSSASPGGGVREKSYPQFRQRSPVSKPRYPHFGHFIRGEGAEEEPGAVVRGGRASDREQFALNVGAKTFGIAAQRVADRNPVQRSKSVVQTATGKQGPRQRHLGFRRCRHREGFDRFDDDGGVGRSPRRPPLNQRHAIDRRPPCDSNDEHGDARHRHPTRLGATSARVAVGRAAGVAARARRLVETDRAGVATGV